MDWPAIDAVKRAKEASEKLRKKAEGFGRPIISTEANGVRIVAVGSRIFQGKNWRFFTDFLIGYGAAVLNLELLTSASKDGVLHPYLRWRSRVLDKSASVTTDGARVLSSNAGFAAAFFRFSYALYLIEHHDRLPERLVRRLRDPGSFPFAALETLVVAAFALAGCKIKMGELVASAEPEGEFVATFGNGNSYSVEAKCKNGWKTSTEDISEPGFVAELRQWLRDRLYASARKKLTNAIYWLELAIPRVEGREAAEAIRNTVRNTLREAETNMTLRGVLPDPAYVIVTNQGFLVHEEGDAGHLAMLDGFHIPMLNDGVVDLEEALEHRDRDRDIFSVLRRMSEVQQVPLHFDGSPAVLGTYEALPPDRIQVGEYVNIQMPDGPNVMGVVMHVVSRGETAVVVVRDPSSKLEKIVEIPLTPVEQKLAQQFGDVVFGNPNPGEKIPDDEPLAIYDFFLEAYSATPRETLLAMVKDEEMRAKFAVLDDGALRRRICREWAKSVIVQSGKGTPRHKPPEAAGDTN